jgi:acetyl-CoA C-acetyltransferase
LWFEQAATNPDIMENVFIVGASRTPIGAFLGGLADVPAVELGALAIRTALSKARVAPDRVDEVFMGNVLSAGIGQAPARQAALAADLPQSVPCTTINKVCGSGLQAVVFGARLLRTGEGSIAVCGGMESMSRTPYYLQKARGGYRMGNGELVDGMIVDGLWDPYHNYHMGQAAELCAAEYKLSREAQDAFAAESYRRALDAIESGAFDAEVVPVEVAQKKGSALVVAHDEEPGRGNIAKFAGLRPSFAQGGTITAANASSLNDGAAAVVLASERSVNAFGLTPLARFVGSAAAAQAPEWFTTAPAKAIAAVLERLNLTVDDIDLFEINEAFSCVVQACAQLGSIPLEKVNVNGGAVALGHPIGASGARVLTTLVHAMNARKARRGLATLCIGGGEAVAVVVELP